MTEVVTLPAAALQPYLYANKQQAFGVSKSDSPHADFQTAAQASLEQTSFSASLVTAPANDRSLQQDTQSHGQNPNNNAPRSHQPPQSSLAANPTPGPSKARIEITPFDLGPTPAQVAGTPDVLQRFDNNGDGRLDQLEVSRAEGTRSKNFTYASLAAGTATPISRAEPTPAPTPAPNLAPVTLPSPGALGPAADLKDADINSIAPNVVGVAFAPTPAASALPDSVGSQTQRDFIFEQRKLFTEEAGQQQASGKFVPEESKAAVALAAAGATPKFDVQPVAVVASTVAGKFAADAGAAQKLFDKGPVDTGGRTADAATGETRLYDKVAQTDTGGKFSDTGGQGQTPSQDGGSDTASRQSLYDRAQAVAQALGNKSDNPSVKQLFAELQLYAATAGIVTDGAAAAQSAPKVKVTA